MNNKVDATINQHSHFRGSAFVHLLSSASRHHSEQLRCMNTLVEFHCAIAAQSKSEASEPPADRMVSQISLDTKFVGDHLPDLFELYTPDLHELVGSLAWDESIAPVDFLIHLLTWIFSLCDAGSPIAAVSFVELALGITGIYDFMFPFR